jgi:hypothetical protein
MRQLVMTLAVAGVIWAGSPLGACAGTPARDIESALAVFDAGRHPARAEVQGALATLVESASRIAVDAGLPAPAPERLAVAAAAYAAGGFLEPENVATVHRAYEAVNEGRAFVFPQEVGSIEEARKYGDGQRLDARAPSPRPGHRRHGDVSAFVGRGDGHAGPLRLAAPPLHAAHQGLAQTLRGFSHTSIEMVTAGLTLLVSACFVSLVALATLGLPWQDRAQAPDSRPPSMASRVAWYGIPFLALVALVVTTLAVITPMKKKMPAPDEPDPATEAPISQRGSPGPSGIG